MGFMHVKPNTKIAKDLLSNSVMHKGKKYKISGIARSPKDVLRFKLLSALSNKKTVTKTIPIFVIFERNK